MNEDRTYRLYRRIAELELQLTAVKIERDELNAAFTSLSQLVYENQPHLIAAEVARRKQEQEEQS